MAKSANQKLKLLYLMKILLELSDEEHPMKVADLIKHLELYGISAERKSIYSDVAMLSEFGLDIVTVKGRQAGYYVGSREFELPELKLLVDAVQSSKFITKKKSEELIEKIEGFTSKYQASALHRQVFVANRIKTMNESIYYTVDYIHSAISKNVQISFKYYEWNDSKEKVLKHGGKDYNASPWALTWDDENYYLVAYDSDAGIIKHYRVDKITSINLIDKKREGEESFSEFDMAIYSKSVFGMFGGKSEYVTLVCDKSLAGVIIDRFGKDIVFLKRDGGRFEINVSVVLSPQFYSWLFGFGGKITLTAPEKAIREFKNQLDEVTNLYK